MMHIKKLKENFKTLLKYNFLKLNVLKQLPTIIIN